MQINIDDIDKAFDIKNQSFDYNFIYENAYLPINKRIPKPKSVIKIRATSGLIDVCTRKNISVLKGKAKSRKTFAGTMFVASMFKFDVYNKFFGDNEDERDVVIFDTEQSEYHVQMIGQRLKKIARFNEQPNRLKIFALRPYTPDQRKNFINEYFEKNQVSLAYIDGARDLLYDINSQKESIDVVTDMMRWSHDNDCHIMTIIHENKAEGSARGHIGSELTNKAESVIDVVKDDDNTSTIKPNMCRGMDFDDIRFEIKDNIPVIDEIFDLINNDDERPF